MRQNSESWNDNNQIIVILFFLLQYTISLATQDQQK